MVNAFQVSEQDKGKRDEEEEEGRKIRALSLRLFVDDRFGLITHTVGAEEE